MVVDFGGYGFYVGLAFSITFLILFLQFLFALRIQKLPVNLPVKNDKELDKLLDTKRQESRFGHTEGVPAGRAPRKARISA